jgi:hypothetical protein
LNTSEQRQRDLELYRLDGRNFEISEEDGVLSLQLRSSASWDRVVIAGMLLVASLLFTFATFLVVAIWLVPLHDTGYWPIVGWMAWPYGRLLGVNLRFFGLRKEAWRIEKTEGLIHSSGFATTKVPIKEIQCVKATHRRRKYFVHLVTRKGAKFGIGCFGYSTKERAWRDDAERIAAFLDLPLEISTS